MKNNVRKKWNTSKILINKEKYFRYFGYQDGIKDYSTIIWNIFKIK
jgi:hypothetical protein